MTSAEEKSAAMSLPCTRWLRLDRPRAGVAQAAGSTERDRLRYERAKRALDLTLSLVLLIVLAPLFLVVAVAIKLDSRGPVIFAQQRMGYDRRSRTPRPFTCYKFRSMVHGCDETPHRQHVQRAILAQRSSPSASPEAALTKLGNDCRVTRVGHLLRKLSIDELPQLWNVMRGEMSLVGPRPVPLYEVEAYAPHHHGRLYAPPGLTGLWQVTGRGNTNIDEMAALDIAYIQQRSLGLDLRILLATVPAVLSAQGAE